MAITKEAIIKASLDILNRDGISNLSMRALAKELIVSDKSTPASLIKGKITLYGLQQVMYSY